jgi:hypothetical protein
MMITLERLMLEVKIYMINDVSAETLSTGWMISLETNSPPGEVSTQQLVIYTCVQRVKPITLPFSHGETALSVPDEG